MKTSRKPFLPVVILFLVLNALFIVFRSRLESLDFDGPTLILGNLFLALITLLSFMVSRRGLDHKNPHVFVRSVYSGIMIKLFITIIAAFIYIATFRKGLNKPAFFTLMGLYLVYTFIE